MLGLIGLGDYWDVEDKGDGEIDSLYPNLWLEQKKKKFWYYLQRQKTQEEKRSRVNIPKELISWHNQLASGA